MALNKNKVIAAAQRFAQKGQLDRAISELRSIVDEEPDDMRIWHRIADLQIRKGAVGQAITTYTRIAGYYEERGFFLKGVAVYKQILNADPTLVDAHRQLGELYVKLGLGPEAIGQFQIVVGTYEREGRHHDSLALLEKIVELGPDDESNRIRLAEAHARQSDTVRAISEFKQTLRQLREKTRVEEYVQVAERLLYLYPEELDVVRALSEVYLERGDPKRALARLQVLFRADPTDPTTLDLLARSFTEIGQIAKAVSVYRELARIHGESGNAAGQRDAWMHLLDLEPGDPEALTATGNARPAERNASGPTPTGGSLGDHTRGETIERHLADVELLLKYELRDHARERLGKVLELDPLNEAGQKKRRDLALADDRPDEAADALMRLADAAEKRGDAQKAMSWLGELIQLRPGDPDAPERMRRISSGMARHLASSAEPFDPGPEPAADYDVDLGEIDFDDGVNDALPIGGFSLDLNALDGSVDDEFADLLDDEPGFKPRPAAPKPSSAAQKPAPKPTITTKPAAAIIVPAAPARFDDFDSFEDEPSDDDAFGDLLSDQPPPADDAFGDLLSDNPPPADDAFGDLLADRDDPSDRLTPNRPADARAHAAPRPAIARPASDDFGGLLADGDDELDDAEQDDAEPAEDAKPADHTFNAGRLRDFGDLLADDEAPDDDPFASPDRRPAALTDRRPADVTSPDRRPAAAPPGRRPATPDDFDDLLAPSGAVTPSPTDDFDDLLAPRATPSPADDFDDLLAPRSTPSPADDFDDLLAPSGAATPSTGDFHDLLAPRTAATPSPADDFDDLDLGANAPLHPERTPSPLDLAPTPPPPTDPLARTPDAPDRRAGHPTTAQPTPSPFDDLDLDAPADPDRTPHPADAHLLTPAHPGANPPDAGFITDLPTRDALPDDDEFADLLLEGSGAVPEPDFGIYRSSDDVQLTPAPTRLPPLSDAPADIDIDVDISENMPQVDLGFPDDEPPINLPASIADLPPPPPPPPRRARPPTPPPPAAEAESDEDEIEELDLDEIDIIELDDADYLDDDDNAAAALDDDAPNATPDPDIITRPPPLSIAPRIPADDENPRDLERRAIDDDDLDLDALATALGTDEAPADDDDDAPDYDATVIAAPALDLTPWLTPHHRDAAATPDAALDAIAGSSTTDHAHRHSAPTPAVSERAPEFDDASEAIGHADAMQPIASAYTERNLDGTRDPADAMNPAEPTAASIEDASDAWELTDHVDDANPAPASHPTGRSAFDDAALTPTGFDDPREPPDPLDPADRKSAALADPETPYDFDGIGLKHTADPSTDPPYAEHTAGPFDDSPDTASSIAHPETPFTDSDGTDDRDATTDDSDDTHRPPAAHPEAFGPASVPVPIPDPESSTAHATPSSAISITTGFAGSTDGTAGSFDSTAGSFDSTAGSRDGTAGPRDGTAGSSDGTTRSFDGTAHLTDSTAGSTDTHAGSFDGTIGSFDGTAAWTATIAGATVPNPGPTDGTTVPTDGTADSTDTFAGSVDAITRPTDVTTRPAGAIAGSTGAITGSTDTIAGSTSATRGSTPTAGATDARSTVHEASDVITREPADTTARPLTRSSATGQRQADPTPATSTATPTTTATPPTANRPLPTPPSPADRLNALRLSKTQPTAPRPLSANTLALGPRGLPTPPKPITPPTATRPSPPRPPAPLASAATEESTLRPAATTPRPPAPETTLRPPATTTPRPPTTEPRPPATTTSRPSTTEPRPPTTEPRPLTTATPRPSTLETSTDTLSARPQTPVASRPLTTPPPPSTEALSARPQTPVASPPLPTPPPPSTDALSARPQTPVTPRPPTTTPPPATPTLTPAEPTQASPEDAAVDLTEELAEVDFLIESGLAADADELLRELHEAYPHHPALLARATTHPETTPPTPEDLDADDFLSGLNDDFDFDLEEVRGAEIADLRDDEADTHFDLGLAFREMGQYDKAIANLELAARRPDKRPDALRLIALCHLDTGDPTAAAATLRRALATPDLTPTSTAHLRYDLATALEHLGDHPAARAELEAITRSLGDFLDITARLARLKG